MRRIFVTLLLALAASAFTQEAQQTAQQDVQTTEGKVTISSRGSDVRNVLFDLFSQTKHNFVLEPNIYFVLYLSLAGVEFQETLDIVCNLAGLDYQIDNGIYYVGKKKPGASLLPKVEPEGNKPIAVQKKGKLTEGELAKKLTTRFTKTLLTDVFKSMSDQTKVQILVDEDVPLYKVDAYLIDTSLQYALEVLMRSTGLKYTLTDDKQVRISKG